MKFSSKRHEQIMRYFLTCAPAATEDALDVVSSTVQCNVNEATDPISAISAINAISENDEFLFKQKAHLNFYCTLNSSRHEASNAYFYECVLNEFSNTTGLASDDYLLDECFQLTSKTITFIVNRVLNPLAEFLIKLPKLFIYDMEKLEGFSDNYNSTNCDSWHKVLNCSLSELLPDNETLAGVYCAFSHAFHVSRKFNHVHWKIHNYLALWFPSKCKLNENEANVPVKVKKILKSLKVRKVN